MIITAYLMGGLGNQMFQISNALSQSWNNKCEYRFNPKSYTPLQGNDTSRYVNNIFKKINFTYDNLVTHRHNEVTWSYYDKPILPNTNIEFYGYYQSSKNFMNYKNKIIDLFSPSDEEINSLTIKYPQIKLNNTVSLHVRRGDYVNSPTIHPVISKSYIQTALKMIGQYSHLFIFTDDRTWVLENLDNENYTIVDDEDYNELWLMSMCENNIISNSTFSWWGSFLNKNETKRVIAPSIWFGDNGPKNYKDIYENNWEIINTKIKEGELVYVA
jgi:hypothetical protein